MALIDSGKAFAGQKVEYSIESDGYIIYLDSKEWVKQRDPYGKIFVPDGTYEDNALAQIEEICNPAEPAPTKEEQLRADIDYIAAMTGITL